MTPKKARQILNVPAGADPETVTRAYRAAVKVAHPDRGGAADQLRDVLEAYKVMKTLAEARFSFAPAPVEPEPAPKPRRQRLEISVCEALFGGERRVKLACGRTVDVKLPQGLRTGDKLRLPASSDGEDVYLSIGMAVEETLSVRGNDLWMKITATAGDLRHGARIEVDTPRGKRSVAIGGAGGDRRLLRLKGEGLPARGNHPQGDLFLRIDPERVEGESKAQSMLRRFTQAWAAA